MKEVVWNIGVSMFKIFEVKGKTLNFFILISVYVYDRLRLSVCLSVYHVHARCPQRPERASYPLDLELQMVVSPLLCGCWEWDQGPLT